MPAANRGADCTSLSKNGIDPAFSSKDTVRLVKTAQSGQTMSSEQLLFDAVANSARRYFPSQRLCRIDLRMDDGDLISLPYPRAHQKELEQHSQESAFASGTIRDTCGRQRAEEALVQSEKRLRLLVEGKDYSIFTLDLDGCIASWNAGAERIKGYRAEEIIGQHFGCFYPREDIEEGKPQRQLRVAAAEGRYEDEGWRVRKDGSRFWASVVITVLRDHDGRPRGFGKVTRDSLSEQFRFRHKNGSWLWIETLGNNLPSVRAIVVNYRDITERKQAEEEIKQSLREKEVLLKEIHHRVKNNLQVISSLLKLQSRSVKDKRVAEMFSESLNRVKSMALVHERLYQSKDMARLNMAEYIRMLTPHLCRSLGVRAKDVLVTIDAEDAWLGIDTAVCCGLLINELVSNSLTHAFPSGKGGEIRIRFGPQPNQTYALIVSDNGVGFPNHVDIRNPQSLGLQLVSALTNQLGATMETRQRRGYYA
jgi:PAS domain S-box-containing protein